MIVEQATCFMIFIGMLLLEARTNNILMFQHLGKSVFTIDEKNFFLRKFSHFNGASLKNWYLDYLNIICFFLIMLLFMFFPLFSSWNINGKVVSAKLINFSDDLLFIFCGFIFFQIFIYIVNFDNYRKLDVVRFGNNFTTLFTVYFFIIASAVMFYETYDLEMIVQSQGMDFNQLYFSWKKCGVYRFPIAALLNIFVLVLYQREKNPYFFSSNISGNYTGSFLQKINFTLYDFLLVTIFVYLFLGGFNLIVGFSQMVEAFPDYLRFFQVFSLCLKIFLVSLSIEWMRILFISRISTGTIWAFERAAIGIGVTGILAMMTLWKY